MAELRVPDLGDFADVEVIEVLVAVGDTVAVEDPLVTIETDKASMDVPAETAGKIISLNVEVGSKVSTGSVIAVVEPSASNTDDESKDDTSKDESSHVATTVMSPAEIAAAVAGVAKGEATHTAQLVVIGAGPGGYTAAFRAADLGLDVILVERSPVLGGVCLNVGCIPSKALLHAAKVIDEAAAMADHGITFNKPKIDTSKLRGWKDEVIGKLTGGLATMAKQRKVRVIKGTAKFESPNRLRLDNGETIEFRNCIIAAGSEPFMLPGLPDDPRIIDSTGALELKSVPKKMLVVGGGIIGLEMACVYSALGADVSVVELMDSLMPGTDPDLLRPFLKIIKNRYEAIMVSTKVTKMRATVPGIEVSFEGDKAPSIGVYDRVLVAIGRRANGGTLDAEKAGVAVDQRGIIAVDKQMRTNVPHIFAIGDLAGGPMLAHKATHEAKVAAEVIAGEKSYFDARSIPSVAYTDPEIAWVGLTEIEAKAKGIDYEKAQFPWAASGRALSIGRPEGFTKLLFDKKTHRVLGGAIVGPSAGDLISEICLAVEMGADASDISLTIHPHPTLSETVAFAAEAFEGTLTDLYIPKKR
ncbi:MAG: dihydrolipoyl dehydrogenase [Gammaproteobacteria bacterium]|nr:dihydrolipoyl dehydrogenase [Gammaproteobacteria bacterium]MDH5240152.1 dihydrolipoyl dehydrogenase [Gammaproteobacteria bacterium]